MSRDKERVDGAGESEVRMFEIQARTILPRGHPPGVEDRPDVRMITLLSQVSRYA